MSSSYQRVEWVHEFEDEPRFIYSELDDERYEMRKIEVFKDGSIVRVSEENPESGSTGLSDLPYPGTEEINANPSEEFHAEEISKAEFEELWNSAG